MSKTKAYVAALLVGILGFGLGAGMTLTGIAFAQDLSQSPVVVMFTRAAQVITTWPRNDALSIGSTTAATIHGGVAKLQVVLNVNDTVGGAYGATSTYLDAFEVASTTGTGSATTTADLFRINNAGCFQVFATSTATPVKLLFAATTTNITAAGGVVDFQYGTCSG